MAYGSVGFVPISVSKSMGRIVANHWNPLVTLQDFQLNHKLKNFPLFYFKPNPISGVIR